MPMRRDGANGRIVFCALLLALVLRLGLAALGHAGNPAAMNDS